MSSVSLTLLLSLALAGCASESGPPPTSYPKPEGPVIGHWEAFKSPDEVRIKSSQALVGNRLYYWGGKLSLDETTSTGGWVDLKTGETGEMSRIGAPPASYYTYSIWTGSELLFFGGRICDQDTRGCFAKGGVAYSPKNDRWRTLQMSGAPESLFLGVDWVGTGLLGFIGSSKASPYSLYVTEDYSVAYFYSIDTDRWTRRQTIDPPSSRSLAATEWMGSEWLIWGGTTETLTNDLRLHTALADGAAYNPSTNRWRKLSSKGAPAASYDVDTAWTGSEVLFWSHSIHVPSFTMAAYNPKSDSWRALNPLGPHREYGSCAVWTGKYFLVCGDQADGQGALYEPKVDRWYPMQDDRRGYFSNAWAWSYGGGALVLGGNDHYDNFPDLGGSWYRIP